MTPQEILTRAPKILAHATREKYFSDGYIGVDSLVDQAWLQRLTDVTADFVEQSRHAAPDDKRFDREPSHSAERPRLRRLHHPLDHHEVYWRFASEGPFADIAEDLLGPNVKVHHAKLNFKWSGGGEAVKWHQDIQFWPHTNYDVLTIGVYLDDVTPDMAPMGVVPASHAGPLYDLVDEHGKWTGYIRDRDLPSVPLHTAEYLGGSAGSITVHNCRSVHGSAPNLSEKCRPLFLVAYAATDAIPLTELTADYRYSETVIRGEASRWPRFDPRPCPLPPNWRRLGGYKSIFAHQRAEE